MRIDEIAFAYVMSNENLLMEDRIQFLKDNTKKLTTDHDEGAPHKETADIIQHFADHGDPTKNKIHTQYLVGLYKAKKFRQEDVDRAKDVLGHFERHKNKLSPEDKQLTVKRYPTLTSVEDKVRPHIGTPVTKNQALNAVKDQALAGKMPGHELKYEDDKIRIFHLKDADTSKKLYASTNDKTPGAVHPTEWCTARDTANNMFNRYNETGKLHVIHRKSDGAVFQYHAHENQFMDHKDGEISHEDFKSIAPSLHKAWEKHPELTD